MERKPIVKKLMAGGTLSTIFIGAMVEGYAQFQDLRKIVVKNKENIAVMKQVDQNQSEGIKRIEKGVDKIIDILIKERTQ